MGQPQHVLAYPSHQQAKKMKCTLQFRLGSYQHPFHACLAVSYAELMGQNPKVNGQFPKDKDGKERKRNWKMDYQFDRYKESAQILKQILYNELYKLVVIKDVIAEYIWYVMAGFLTISISSHSIANIQCEYSTEEMKKTAMDLQDQEEEMQANQKSPSLYTVTN